jgi:hypothetical protein
MAANKDGDAIDVRGALAGIVHLAWTGASATDATVKVQESGDGTNWKDVASASATVGAASGSAIIKLTSDVLLSPWLRAVFTKNTETTGTVTVGYFFKGNR